MFRSFRPLTTLLLVLTLLLHTAAILPVSAAPSPSITLKSQAYKNGTAKYPVVSGLANKEVQDRINRFMLKEAQEFMKGSREAQTAQWDASVVYNQKGYISFVVFYDIYYEGAAHGLPGLKGYTFEAANGRLLRLRDLYDITGPGRTIINNEIIRQVEEQQIGLFEAFAGIGDNPEFYLVPDNVVIVYNPYEIAPFAAGILEFPIPAKHH